MVGFCQPAIAQLLWTGPGAAFPVRPSCDLWSFQPKRGTPGNEQPYAGPSVSLTGATRISAKDSRAFIT